MIPSKQVKACFAFGGNKASDYNVRIKLSVICIAAEKNTFINNLMNSKNRTNVDRKELGSS